MNFQTLQNGIEDRQKELHNLAEILGESAQVKGHWAATAKFSIIVLGAFVATQGVAAKVWGDNRPVITILYTTVGLLIAAVSGLEAAFKTESRSSALKALATRCQITISQIDTQWRETIGIHGDRSNDLTKEESRIKAAIVLLRLQDQVLGDVQSKAAELGVNVTHQVRKLYVDGDVPFAA